MVEHSRSTPSPPCVVTGRDPSPRSFEILKAEADLGNGQFGRTFSSNSQRSQLSRRKSSLTSEGSSGTRSRALQHSSPDSLSISPQGEPPLHPSIQAGRVKPSSARAGRLREATNCSLWHVAVKGCVLDETAGRAKVEEEEKAQAEVLHRELQMSYRIVRHCESNPSRAVPEKVEQPAHSSRYVKTNRILGQGAYATVYEGHDEETGRFVAIKEIQFVADDPDNRARMASIAQEIRTMKDLSENRYIVQYLGAERIGCTLYIYMEYVSGGSISQALRMLGPFSERIVRLYTKQILLGLEFLHSKKIVHRDIKGENVLLEKTNGQIKLTDFNSSKYIQSAYPVCNTVRGTPWFMAPE
eukprot:Sspe_Gene.47534::Locus_24286_Transcript_1_1_Confidence_1.000_Length_1145::g.47534::m.47534